MRTTVIDSKGRLWGPNDPQFLASIDAPSASASVLDYVARNLGYAVVAVGNRSLLIRLRPAIIKPVALSETLHWCLAQCSDRAMVIYFSEATEDWTHVIVPSANDTAQRLVDLVNDEQLRPRQPFQRTLVDLALLPNDHALAPLVARWHQTGGKLEPCGLHPLLERTFSGRHMTVRVLEKGAHLIMSSIASGYNFIKPSVQTGHRIEDQPDYAYGRWVAESYREADREGVPVLERIDATLQRPSQRFRYERLILPCSSPCGERLLVSGTLYN